MKHATDLKNYLDLPIPDGHLFDTWTWEQRTLEACNVCGPDALQAKENWFRYSNIRKTIHNAHVFDSPTGFQGLFYSKPSEYLAIGFYESKRPKVQILEEIDKLLTRKSPLSCRIFEILG